MKKSKVVLGLLAVFVSGLIIGAASGTYYMKEKMAEFFDNPPSPPDEFIVQRLSDDLRLSAKQRQAAEVIVAEASKRARAEISMVKPRLDAILDEMAARLKEHLDPAQRESLDEIVVRIKTHKGPPPFRSGPGGLEQRPPKAP
jgi:Lon protease-like protein